MHGFKVHFRSPASSPVKKISVRPFKYFSFSFPLPLLNRKKGILDEHTSGVLGESERIDKLTFLQYSSS